MSGKGGSSTFFPVDPRLLTATVQVRNLLPKAVHASKGWSQLGICPDCKGPKNKMAAHCLTCYRRRRSVMRARDAAYQRGERNQVTPVMPTTSMHGLGHGRKMSGVPVDQPSRKRMVRSTDGQWVEVDW